MQCFIIAYLVFLEKASVAKPVSASEERSPTKLVFFSITAVYIRYIEYLALFIRLQTVHCDQSFRPTRRTNKTEDVVVSAIPTAIFANDHLER